VGLPPLGPGHPLVFMAGPCVIEDMDQTVVIAARLKSLNVPLIFKASFDKANRTHADAYRGPGLQGGLRVLAEVKSRFGLPVMTDVHRPEHCAAAAQVVDVIQIPAFLCRQTDLLEAAAATGLPVHVKRGQFLDPRALVWMRQAGVPVVFDCTHSNQRPGAGPQTDGDREMAFPLARAAAAVGIDGLFAEVHLDPRKARSDASTQLTFPQFKRLVAEVQAIDAARRALP
jgi:2-dehydro-3-deoxyphosphooctonate aldolase (KDO 8-P synthase)